MKELGIAIEGGLLIGCAWLLVTLCFCALGCRIWRGWKVFKRKRKAVALGLLACAAAIVGGTKVQMGTVSVGNDPYITDAGSYVTNDYVHIAISPRFDFVGMDTEIWIYSRELSQTNAEDWIKLVRVEEGEYTLGEFPMDIAFPHATNYNFLVAAKYIPTPTVHTNGVWSIKGFIVPSSGNPPSPATYGFPNTKAILKEDQ